MPYDWLPQKTILNDFPTEEDYINHLYHGFEADFLISERSFQGLPIKIKRHPPYDGIFEGKTATFRHLITEGKDEVNRTVSYPRAETLGWALPVIEALGGPDVLVWENERQTNGGAYIISLSDFSYKVVLTKRKDFVLLWTQFPVEHEHSRNKMRKECERYVASKS